MRLKPRRQDLLVVLGQRDPRHRVILFRAGHGRSTTPFQAPAGSLDAVDDRLLKVTFAPPGALVESEELEHEGILENVAWNLDLLPATRERQQLLLVPAFVEALEQKRCDLPLQRTARPTLPNGLDLTCAPWTLPGLQEPFWPQSAIGCGDYQLALQ